MGTLCLPEASRAIGDGWVLGRERKIQIISTELPGVTREHLVSIMAEAFECGESSFVIDYDHASLEDKSAPWAGVITSLELKFPQSGFMQITGKARFTQRAESKIKHGGYRYISACYELGMSDARGKRILARLHSAALTREPIIADAQRIEEIS
jgi:phage I-like protein